MRPIDGDALDKYLREAEVEAHRIKMYVMEGVINSMRGNLRNFPTIEPERKHCGSYNGGGKDA